MKTVTHTGIAACATVVLLIAGCTGGGGGLANLFIGDVQPSRYIGQEPPMTILLVVYNGPDARATAERVMQDLKDIDFPKTFVVADADEAYVCHGIYSGFDDPAYKKDKDRLAQVRDPQGLSAFGRPLASTLPEPAPPTRYPLQKADGEFTVQVGVFDLYGRKREAIDYTDRLRRQGWEAYTFHGDTQSLVTIGAYGKVIFDNWARTQNPYDPPKVVSSDVKNVLANFPCLNWNGHQFTPKEVKEIKITKQTSGIASRDRTGGQARKVDISAALLTSKIVRIPEPEAERLEMPKPVASPDSGGPIPSPSRGIPW